MRRLLFFLVLAALAAALCGCGLWDACVFYSGGEISDGFYCCSNTLPFMQRAFVSVYQWDGTEEGQTILVPDTFHGKRITKLGGYEGSGAPSPFFVRLPDGYRGGIRYSSARAEESVAVENILFVLRLGKFISKMELIDGRSCYYCGEGESFVCIRPAYYVECSPENPNLYSENGRLYSRADDSLIEDFFYWDEATAAE